MHPIRSYIAEWNPMAVLWDDLDDALIGYTDDCKAVYDINKMVKCLSTKMEGCTEEEVMEYIEFNILCAYVGEFTPIHIYIP